MGRPLVLLAAALLVPLLAGCSGRSPDPEPPSPLSTGAGDLRAGRFYAFAHGGGELAFAVPANGSAEVVLYGADDRRVGHVGLGAAQASGRFVLDGLAAGELVLDVKSVNGTLDVRSGGAPVAAFRELPRHVERHVLVSRPSQTPVVAFLTGDSLSHSVNVSLLRAPTDLRVFAHQASFQDLSVEVSGREGTVFELFAGGPAPFPSYEGVLSGRVYPENVRDGALTATLESSAFEGTLVLEADSFSRASIAAGGAHETGDVPRFTYGALPEGEPVSFEVSGRAQTLYLWVEEDGRSSTTQSRDPSGERCSASASSSSACEEPDDRPAVALFGPRDERVATVLVPGNQTLAVPVSEAGTWVAVLLRGEATLGADAVPGDFELHPLDTVQAQTPSSAAGGSDGSYGERREVLEVRGVPFRIESAVEYPTGDLIGMPDFGFGGCRGAGITALRDGETIAAWGYWEIPEPTWDPDLYLGEGVLEAVHSDYGGACDRPVLVVTGYER